MRVHLRSEAHSGGSRLTRGFFFTALTGALLALGLAGCGTGGGSTSTGGTSVTCPSASTTASWHLVNSGKLTVASDTTYAPAEYADPNNPTQFIGYDMDLAREIARRLCLTASIQKADFGSIIPDISGPALGSQRYDMSISSFTINPDRKQKVDMIPYFTAGESLLVPSGNPKGFTSDFSSLCGHTIAVQDNTVEQGEVNDANGTGDGTSGQKPVCKTNRIKILHFADQTVVVQQVVSGNAEASYQDSPVTGYYAKLNTSLQVGPVTVAPSPEGIVVRKDNLPLEQAITNALNAMRSDGTYLKILTTWGQQSGVYPPLS